jgi:endonuclease/exonuclease/phosphatase family metal-dependent hydrolase
MAMTPLPRQVEHDLRRGLPGWTRSGWWLLLLLVGAGAHAQSLGVATWNVGWLLDETTHARWTATCAKHGWPQDTSALAADARAALASLPYCNVHNGMQFPPDYCRTRRNGWPRAARYPAQHPCRETADLAAWPDYQRKVAALRAMFAQLDRDGVGIVALQEVSSAAAVAPILPAGWRVATTAELPGTPGIAQHVGVAWKAGIDLRGVEAVNALADSGFPDRPLRPGLAFTVDVGRQPVRVMAVHLKAGCRSRAIDAPLTPREAARLPPARQDTIVSDCAKLRYQLPALEAWIDAQGEKAFAVVGDFNRTLLREPTAERDGYRVRLDHSRATDPLGPCTMRRENGRAVVQCAATTRAMFPELNDDMPKGTVLWRARFVDLGHGGTIPRDSSGDCRIAGPHGELTHDGVDHVLISDALKRRLSTDSLTMRVRNYSDDAGAPLKASTTTALPSDHCPHVVVWTPRP